MHVSQVWCDGESFFCIVFLFEELNTAYEQMMKEDLACMIIFGWGTRTRSGRRTLHINAVKSCSIYLTRCCMQCTNATHEWWCTMQCAVLCILLLLHGGTHHYALSSSSTINISQPLSHTSLWPCLVFKNFQNSSLPRMFGHIHRALNIDEKNNHTVW
jgi:hypothetical protein